MTTTITASLTTINVWVSKGGGGGFDAGDSSGKRGLMREASGFKPWLALASHGVPFLIAVKNRSHRL
jgi:hypothetical protein